MDYRYIILVFTVAFLCAFVITPLVKKMAIKLNAIDIPKDERRVHKIPIPRLGGLAILGGFLIALLIYYVIARDVDKSVFDIELIGLLLGICIIEIAGIWDDIKPIKAWTKLMFQIAAAAVVIAFGVRIEGLSNPFVENGFIDLGVLSIPITLVWIVGITNALNFIDGLDGLAAGIASISSLALLFIAVYLKNVEVVILASALAGATLGFLPFNFNPAKIFMGETGSAFLGFTLGTISIMGLMKSYTAITIVIAPLIVLGLPIFDTAFAIIRRLLKGKSPMVADRGHLHHRMVDAGLTQKQTVLILYIVSAFLGLIALMLVQGIWKAIMLVIAIIFFIFAGQKFMIDSHNNENKE